MNFEQVYLAHDEVEINIKRIVQQCIKNLRWILLCTVICAIGLGVIVYAKDMKEYKQKQEISNVQTFTEVEEVQIERYFFLKKKVEHSEEYVEKSQILKMDCANVYQWNAMFYIDNNSSTRVEIANMILNYLSSERFKEELYEKINYIEEEYINEGISASIGGYNSAVLKVSLLAKDEAECKDYINAIKELLENYSNELQFQIDAHTLKIVYEETKNGFEEKVYTVQNNQYNNVDSASKALANHFAASTDNVKNYILGLEPKEEVVKPTIEIKTIVLGALIGFVVASIAIVVLTLFDGKVQSERELHKRLNITNFGTIKENAEELQLISVRILKLMQNNNINTINFISTVEELESSDMKDLYKILKSVKVDYTVLGNVLKDKKVIENIEKNAPTILVETIGKSKVKDIYQEAMMCKDLEINVLGYISLESK